eukprot:5476217-Pleurochrysis_carterae.AAC.3
MSSCMQCVCFISGMRGSASSIHQFLCLVKHALSADRASAELHEKARRAVQTADDSAYSSVINLGAPSARRHARRWRPRRWPRCYLCYERSAPRRREQRLLFSGGAGASAELRGLD